MTNSADAPDPARLQTLADELVSLALKAGADSAEATVSESRSFELSMREGALEDVGRSESLDAGVRVFVGRQPAGVAFSDLSPDGARQSVERAVAMARHAPEDPYAGLAEPGQLAAERPDIPMFDPTEWGPAELEDMATRLERAGRAVPGVTMTEGAFASTGSGAAGYVASNGFAASWRGSSFQYGVSLIAEKDGAMERDYSVTSARRPADLRDLEEVGREAGERAAARVGPVKLASGPRPVVFDRRVSTTFLSSLAGAVNGAAVARGVSFLREKMGEQIFSETITIMDEPHRPWGMGSAPFDAEGLPNSASAVIDEGRLTGWFLNLAAARQLGLAPTGHARRNLGGPPGAGPTNLYMKPSAQSRADMIAGIEDGLLVSEMFGPSLNPNTGDWSVGVSGYRILKGAIDHPVSEITVAGNLLDIYARLQPADDLRFDHAVNAPSVLVDDLAVGGA